MKGIANSCDVSRRTIILFWHYVNHRAIVHRTNEQVSAITKKVSETGIIDVSTSITDKKIALEYGNFMAGDGDIELNQERA